MEPVEHRFVCPYCWQSITMVIEPSADEQEYVEDCEVCCNPIQVAFRVDDEDDGVVFSATQLGQ